MTPRASLSGAGTGACWTTGVLERSLRGPTRGGPSYGSLQICAAGVASGDAAMLVGGRVKAGVDARVLPLSSGAGVIACFQNEMRLKT